MMVDSYELNQISKRSLQCFIYWNQSIEPLLLGTYGKCVLFNPYQ